MEWSKKWPDKVGLYWFYGYRYGKISCGTECEPELCLVNVQKAANGLMFTTDGQFMELSETEEAHFQKAIIPEFPSLTEKKGAD